MIPSMSVQRCDPTLVSLPVRKTIRQAECQLDAIGSHLLFLRSFALFFLNTWLAAVQAVYFGHSTRLKKTAGPIDE
tara:strand:+ start:987 stop:1214 length:228 start_codon:yes stop_codon:yes gene_type:complete